MSEHTSGRDSGKVEGVPGVWQTNHTCRSRSAWGTCRSWPLWAPFHPGSHLTLITTCKVCIIIPVLQLRMLGCRDAKCLGYPLLCVPEGPSSLGHFLGALITWSYRISDFSFTAADNLRKVKERDSARLRLWMNAIYLVLPCFQLSPFDF